jgi:hypothetical protein
MKRLITLTLALVAIAVAAGASGKLNSWTNINALAALSLGNEFNTSAPPPQTIKICKKTFPAGGTGFQFLRSNGAGPLPSFPLNDGQCNTMNLAGQDHYNKFTENVAPGWALTNIACTYTTSAVAIIGANANPAFQAGDKTVTIDLNEANVTCTFYNRQLPCCPYTFDLSTGQGSPTDPIWKVNNANAYTTSAHPSWLSLNPAKWIQPKNSPNPASVSGPNPLYKYTVKFVVPNCANGHVELHGSFAADNSGTALLDGNAIPGASCAGPTCFNTSQAPVPLNVALVTPGSHTLEIVVKNNSYGASGLIVNAKLTTVCP